MRNKIPSRPHQGPVALTFLYANRMGLLGDIALRRALEVSNVPIYLGYVDETDLSEICFDSRINRIQLKRSQKILQGFESDLRNYVDFSTDQFFQIVTLKWDLFEAVFQQNHRFIIYSDLDVLWIKNPVDDLVENFLQDDRIHVQIQSFSSKPNETKLCMGFIAMRKSKEVSELITECRRIHMEALSKGARFGDDDAISEFYRRSFFPKWIKELPQSTFPVGNLTNLYSKKHLFPGISSPTPYIFHANFVIGMESKLQLVALVADHLNIEIFTFLKRHQFRVLIYLRRVKLKIGNLKKRLRGLEIKSESM